MGNYYLYQIAVFITRLLPVSLSYALAVFISDCQYLLSSVDRGEVTKNLQVILNSQRVPASMVRSVFRNFGKYLVDFFTMTKRVDKDFIKESVEMFGTEHLNKVLKEGKGGIILSAHLGSWEMGAAILGVLGYPLSVVALSHKDTRVNAFFNQQREFFGTSVIQTSVAIRRCMEDLRRNRLVAILADRDFGHHGIPMDFLGRKALMPKGAALFAFKTGAPLIPAFFMRTAKENKYHIVFQQPIYPPVVDKKRNITDVDLKDFMQKYLKLIEIEIRNNPSQWLMFRHFEKI